MVGSALSTVFFTLFKLNLSLPDFSLALISFCNRTCETGRENVTGSVVCPPLQRWWGRTMGP